MRICLVDDDSTQLDYLKLLISKWSNINNVNIDVNFYHSAEEMLFENEKSYPFDMIILDIQMGNINGLELAKRIRETDTQVLIAFISGMADYVFEGYNVQAVRYILKPVIEEKVYELLDYLKKYKSTDRKYLVLSAFGEKRKVYFDEIVYLESKGHYVSFYLVDKQYEYKYNISDLCGELPEADFVKTHRSYIANVKYIERVTKTDCYLLKDISIPLSRSSYKSVNEKFISYHKGRS